ncbi:MULTISPECIES: hypothetical protein [unclassified Microcoleus]|uniref:hypothetical protein n=1 Tax=unclassified Microcoleus TaxID=2642155 RepID=UPI002FD6C507
MNQQLIELRICGLRCLHNMICGSVAALVGRSETDLRKIRPSCRAQFDPILPSLSAFVWQEAREGERLSPVALWTIAHGWHLPRLKEVVAGRLMRKCLN